MPRITRAAIMDGFAPPVPESWKGERKWAPDGMADILEQGLQLNVDAGYWCDRERDASGRSLVTMRSGRVAMSDVLANAKVVAALIATQRDDDWVNNDLVLHAMKALDLRYRGRLSGTADIFIQGIWAGHESSKLRQVYKYFLLLVKKSKWSDHRLLNELKEQWMNLHGAPAPGDDVSVDSQSRSASPATGPSEHLVSPADSRYQSPPRTRTTPPGTPPSSATRSLVFPAETHSQATADTEAAPESIAGDADTEAKPECPPGAESGTMEIAPGSGPECSPASGSTSSWSAEPKAGEMSTEDMLRQIGAGTFNYNCTASEQARWIVATAKKERKARQAAPPPAAPQASPLPAARRPEPPPTPAGLDGRILSLTCLDATDHVGHKHQIAQRKKIFRKPAICFKVRQGEKRYDPEADTTDDDGLKIFKKPASFRRDCLRQDTLSDMLSDVMPSDIEDGGADQDGNTQEETPRLHRDLSGRRRLTGKKTGRPVCQMYSRKRKAPTAEAKSKTATPQAKGKSKTAAEAKSRSEEQDGDAGNAARKGKELSSMTTPKADEKSKTATAQAKGKSKPATPKAKGQGKQKGQNKSETIVPHDKERVTRLLNMFGAQAGSAADGCREAAAVTASRSMQYNRPLYRVFYNQKAFVQITPARYGGCELATQDVCFLFKMLCRAGASKEAVESIKKSSEFSQALFRGTESPDFSLSSAAAD